ncbi:MAG TPA: M12 family metallo-peptidase [Povalibacter sp.]|uniref:M12 family metallo-peptidase n=1 Tax=Povalibacter sp. TaxID=1962978 RepID=UPI002CC008A8|nr:M12 family metallo-peptidase [Povalibacter sp.]HMN44750.1 M12 family metallo-peptidase [Povalibacter sp.]
MAADAGPLRILAHEPFHPLPVVVNGSAKPSAGSLRTFRFDAFGRRFSLLLEPNERLTPAVSAEGPSLSLYQGTVENVPGSWARLSAKGQTIRGAFWDGRELYLVDSAAAVDPAADTDDTVIFRLSDTEVPAGTTFCSDDPAAGMSGKAAYTQMLHELKSTPVIMQAAGATLRLEISAIADALFRNRYASDQQARDEILNRINIVDGIYSSQLQVEIQVPTMNIGDDDVAGRLSTTVNASNLIEDLGRLRRSTPVLRARGLTHLFTGRDLDGSTVGIAFNGRLCDAQYSTGLTQTSTFTTLDALVTAHEIGHVFGAPHDGSGACTNTATGQYLMSPSVGTNVSSFSDCSLAQMRPRIASANCLLPLIAPDLEIPADLGTSNHVVGESFDWALTITNKGGSIAYGSSATLEVPPVVSIREAFVVGGTCTASPVGRVQCSVGDIPAGGSRVVNLKMASDVLGSNSISARVFAPDETQTANNLGDGTLVIDPKAPDAVSTPSQGPRNGGGSIDALWLAFLGALAGLRRRRASNASR